MKYTFLLAALSLVAAAPADSDASAYSNVLDIINKHQGQHAKRDVADSAQDRYLVFFKNGTSIQSINGHIQNLDSKVSSSVSAMSGAAASGFAAIHQGIQGAFDVSALSNGQGFQGYFGSFNSSVLDSIRSSPDVASVEKDSIVSLGQQAAPVPVNITKLSKRDFESKQVAQWGLGRISHLNNNVQNINPDQPSTVRVPFTRETSKYGTTVYVVDTGTYVEHQDFGGRARWGANFVQGEPMKDLNGHGTHVSGIVAGSTVGVSAEKTTIVAVKVLNQKGEGYASTIIQGMNWVLSDYQNSGQKRSVINFSGGGASSYGLDQVFQQAVQQYGIPTVVAAGNNGQDACNESPARASRNLPGLITVGATDHLDNIVVSKEWQSAKGQCVEVFAPGQTILSLWITNDDAAATMGGTSMASPHVAGTIAYFQSIADQIVPAAVLESWVRDGSVNRVKGDLAGASNNMVWNRASF